MQEKVPLDKQTIVEDIKQWVFNYLDIPSKHYNDQKPCPFAKTAWIRNKVKVVFGTEDEVEQQISDWTDTHQLVIVVYDADEWNAEEWTQARNKQLCKDNLYLMPFDPDGDDPEDDSLDPIAWGSVTEDVYGMVFIQNLSELNHFSEILDKQGYYKGLSEEFNNYVKRRELANGNG